MKWQRQLKRRTSAVLGAQVVVAAIAISSAMVPSAMAITAPTAFLYAAFQVTEDGTVSNFECKDCGGPESSSGAGGH